MFKVVTLPVGQLRTNCYLLIDKKTADTLIIDPGDDADYIERIMTDKKCKPLKIVATHGHFDHIMAATELKLAYNLPFLINKKDEFLVKNLKSSAKYFLGIETDPPPPINGYLKEKENIELGNNLLEIIATPGHTPGSLCLYSKESNILFTGDLLFADGGVGRTDFSYSSSSDLAASLTKIFHLPAQTKIFPGHGRSSTLGKEKFYHNLL